MCKEKVKDEIQNKSDDILSILEKPGKYQAWQYILACLPATFVSMLSVNFVFVAGDVNYRCRVPECESNEPTYSPSWWPDTNVDRCYRPVLNSSLVQAGLSCSNSSFTAAVEACTDWIYETNNTIVAELDLACEPWKANFVGTIHGIGAIVAMVASGWMCDRFGRKPTLIICAVACVMGNLKVFAKSYNMYIFLEFLEATLSLGAYTAGSVIMTENSSTKTRIVAGVLFAYAIYLGEALFATIAMAVPYWKHLLYIICTPSLLFLSYIFILRESPRWQILNGKINEAKDTLKLIVKTNKLKIDTHEIEKLNDDELRKMFNLDDTLKREGFREMFKSNEILKRLAGGIVWRLAASFIYYSLVVNSVYLPGDKYTNFLLTAITSFPGEMLSLYFMNKIGRRKPLGSGFLLCGLTCVASAYVPETYKWVKLILFLIGKLLVSACYTGTVVYTMELFPTSVRGVGIGICTLASCAGSMIAPLSPALTLISPVLASFCFAFMAILASSILLITPETKDTPLLDTIEQVNNIAKNKKDNTKTTESNENGTQNMGYDEEV